MSSVNHKYHQNQKLIQLSQKHFFGDGPVNIFLLDDIDIQSTQSFLDLRDPIVPPNRIYCPNPNPDIVKKLQAAGVNSKCTLAEKYIRECPPCNIVYLDFCGAPGGNVSKGLFPFTVIMEVAKWKLKKLVLFVTFSSHMNTKGKYLMSDNGLGGKDDTCMDLAEHQLKAIFNEFRWKIIEWNNYGPYGQEFQFQIVLEKVKYSEPADYVVMSVENDPTVKLIMGCDPSILESYIMV